MLVIHSKAEKMSVIRRKLLLLHMAPEFIAASASATYNVMTAVEGASIGWSDMV